ncbi:MAG: hypothetical protein D8H94_17795 [Cardiobacterium sp.]|nr:MAG: hypothetical protein D8H94_17795 [Cardiobacterium sp.]
MSELSGCIILYTRDSSHYPAFRACITALGGTTYHLPLMATAPQPLSAADRSILDSSDTLVFTSAAAVQHLLAQYPLRGQQTITIGTATAAALPCPPNRCAPPPYNSETLLADWQPHGARIALIAAQEGRQMLTETLSKLSVLPLLPPCPARPTAAPRRPITAKHYSPTGNRMARASPLSPHRKADRCLRKPSVKTIPCTPSIPTAAPTQAHTIHPPCQSRTSSPLPASKPLITCSQ